MTLGRLIACSLSASVALALPAAAQEAPVEEPPADTSDLLSMLGESVVSTASKSAERSSAAPGTSVSISSDDLRRYGIQSLDEAINFLSLGMVTQNPLHSVDIGARGVLLTGDFGNHVLLLVNGHAMNEQWDGTAYFERGAAIPMELIDHIEIIVGPGSVLYGSNAMLGVINVITKRAKEYAGLHLVAEADGLQPYSGTWLSSARVAAGFGREFTLGEQSGEVIGQVEYYGQSGPAFTFGPQTVSDETTTTTWGGKATRSYATQIPTGFLHAILGDWELNARVASYRRSTPYVNQFNQTIGDFNDPFNHELDRWIDLDLRHQLRISSTVSLQSRLYGDLYRYDQDLRSSTAADCQGGLTACDFHAYGQSRWAGLELQPSIDWTGDGRTVTLIGVDGRVRQVESQAAIAPVGSEQSVATYGRIQRTELSTGIYLQQTLRPVQPLQLSLGVRLDVDQRFGRHLSPRVAARVALWQGAAIKAAYSEAFRAPTSYEISYEEPNAVIGNPSLRPEIVRSVEGSLEQQIGAHRLLLGAFFSRWTDLVQSVMLADDDPALADARARGIVDATATDIQQYRNASSLVNWGFNAGAEGRALDGDFRYGLSVTYGHSRRDGSSDPLPVAPALFGNARLAYRLPAALPEIGLALFACARRPADRAWDGGFTPVPYAPAEAEVRLTFSGAVPGASRLSYRLSANFVTAGAAPYVVGPNQSASAAQPSAELAPVDRFRTFLGLQYDL
jgi:outer membrane receptor protein involved in Fe transport